LRDTQWHGHGDYDHWMSTSLNNAKLLPFGLYDQYVSAFAALFRQCHGEWKLFYQRVRAISKQDAARRQAFLTGTSAVAH
jgi:predicted aminopeptidase